MSVRYEVSDCIKKQIAGKQHFKCANKPNVVLNKLEDYDCPMWDRKTDVGSFDESGYDIDHKTEYCLTKNNNINNLQALCKPCHIVKTRNFMRDHTINKKIKINKDNKDNKDNKKDSETKPNIINQKVELKKPQIKKKKIFMCIKCERRFTRNEALIHHKEHKSCERSALLMVKNKKILNKINKKNNKNVINNGLNLIIPINPVSFGDENKEFFSDEFYINILNRGHEAIHDFIKLIHFNQSYPQYKNIYVSDRSRKRILYLNFGTWRLGRSNMIDDIINKVILLLKKNLNN
jgi:hypothetical protein